MAEKQTLLKSHNLLYEHMEFVKFSIIIPPLKTAKHSIFLHETKQMPLMNYESDLYLVTHDSLASIYYLLGEQTFILSVSQVSERWKISGRSCIQTI